MYTRNDLELMYLCGTRAGLAGFYVAFLASGLESETESLYAIKEKAKAALDAVDGFGEAMKQLAEEKAKAASAGKHHEL